MEDLLLKITDGLFGGENSRFNFDAVALVKIAIVIIITIAALIALTILNKRIVLKFKSNNDIKRAQIFRISFRVTRILVIITGVIAILQTLGINLIGLSAGFGIIVILLVLAVKDALADVFAGVVIMTDRYFNVGDAVEYEGMEGVVVSFTARTTKIELLEDRSVVAVANRNISQIRKLTHLVDIDLPLPYELSAKDAFSALNDICKQIRKIEGVEKCELKGTQDFGASAIMYKIRFFCKPHDRQDIRREVLRTIQDGLEAVQIRIPYQQIDIHEK